MSKSYGLADQIRVPQADGTYRDYSILHLLGFGHSMLSSAKGFGMPPIRIIEQRGPLQHGTTVLDYRYEPRVIQVVINQRLACRTDLVERRWWLVDLLRPSRVFPSSGAARPLIYRRWLPGGKVIRGTDLELTAGSAIVKANQGRFVHFGLRAGDRFTISNSTADDGDYAVVSVYHDGSLVLDAAMSTDESGVHYRYQSGPSRRDLFCVLELGPAFDMEDVAVHGYIEALRFLAFDPFWYGAEQEQSWSLPAEFDNLVFDYGDTGVDAEDAGAWFGASVGEGRWIFADNYLSEEIEVPYWGHETAVPVITITGPANRPVIENVSTGTQIALDYDVPAGNVVQIDTLNLTVIDQDGNDLFMYLTGDVVGFGLSPGAGNNRVNTLRVDFGGATASSAVSIRWRNRYATI